MFASKGRSYFPAPLLLSERRTALRFIDFNTVRQHAILLPGAQFGARRRPRLWKFNNFQAAADLRNHDVGSPELLRQLSLIPEVCPIQILSKSDEPMLSTSQLKTRVAPNSFASKGRPYFPAPLLLSERRTALRVIAFNTVRQHAILLLGAQFGARRRPHSWKFNNFQQLRNLCCSRSPDP